MASPQTHEEYMKEVERKRREAVNKPYKTFETTEDLDKYKQLARDLYEAEAAKSKWKEINELLLQRLGGKAPSAAEITSNLGLSMAAEKQARARAGGNAALAASATSTKPTAGVLERGAQTRSLEQEKAQRTASGSLMAQEKFTQNLRQQGLTQAYAERYGQIMRERMKLEAKRLKEMKAWQDKMFALQMVSTWVDAFSSGMMGMGTKGGGGPGGGGGGSFSSEPITQSQAPSQAYDLSLGGIVNEDIR